MRSQPCPVEFPIDHSKESRGNLSAEGSLEGLISGREEEYQGRGYYSIEELCEEQLKWLHRRELAD